jgi:general secretion pathway protein F
MSEFSYRAVNRDNQEEEGLIEALTVAEAGRKLLGRGLYPLDVSPQGSLRSLLNSNVSLGGLSRTELAQLINDIGHLLTAGVEVATALALVKATGSKKSRGPVNQLLERVRKGLSLSEAMREAPELFASHVVAVVAACEASSNALGPGLLRIADNLRKTTALRSQVQTALIYPGAIALAVGAAITVLITVVVPTLEGLFADHAAHLPWQTRFLISMSETIRQNYIKFSGLLCVAVAVPVVSMRTPSLKIRIEQLALRLPVIGEFVRSVETAQVSTMLAMLAISGVPLVDAVTMTSRGARLLISREALTEAIGQLREGRRLHEALAGAAALSPRVLAIVRIGESTGRLGPLLEEASRDAERQVAIMTERTLAILPPAMTLLFGIVAGFVLYAVMTAILSVNTFATHGA